MARYIDANALIEKLNKNSIFSKITNAEDKSVIDIINEQPTAFDVDAVAEKVYDLLSEHDISVWKEIDHIELADEWVRIINETYDGNLGYSKLEEKRVNSLKEYLEKAGGEP